MPDHINIHPPRRRDELEDRLKFERMQAELTVLREACTIPTARSC
jgi:hypothetical protein